MTGADVERFWSKVGRRGPGECWPWLATKTPSGYGMFRFGGRMRPAHRVAYELQSVPILDGLQLDHLCRNRACVNPAHLEPVTQRENILRGVSFSAGNAQKSRCPEGHLYDAKNTWIYRGARRCKTCKRARWRAWDAAKRSA